MKTLIQYVYVVEMLRDGDRERHSYIAGVYSDRKIAELEAELHMGMRAGKYNAEIREEQIDGYGGRGLVCYVEDAYLDNEDYEIDIKSREEYLKHKAEKNEEWRKKNLTDN